MNADQLDRFAIRELIKNWGAGRKAKSEKRKAKSEKLGITGRKPSFESGGFPVVRL